MGKIFESNEKMFEFAMMLPKRSVLRTQRLSAKELFFFFRSDGLPLVAIAQIARVEPVVLHFLYCGKKIPEKAEERLRVVHDLFTEASHASPGEFYRFWKRELPFGKSFEALLEEEQLNHTLIRKALFILDLWIEEHKRKHPKLPKIPGQQNSFFAALPEVYLDDESDKPQ